MKRIALALSLLLTLGTGRASALVIDSQEASGLAHRSTVSPTAGTAFNNAAGTVMYTGVVVTSSTGGTSTITTVKYNGVTMTAIGTGQAWDTVASKVQWFRLLSPATGSNNIIITWSGGSNAAVLWGSISFSANNTSTPEGTEVKATGNGTAVDSGAVTSTSGNIIISVGGSGTTGATTVFTPISPDVKTFFVGGSSTTAGDNLYASTFTSAGASHNMKWTIPSDNWGIVALEIKAAAGGGATSHPCSGLRLLGVGCEAQP